MGNSPLVVYTKYSPHNSGKRTMAIDRITPHCVVGQCSIEALGAEFAKPTKNASSNYGIDKDGRVGVFVDEDKVSWCSSSSANDRRAVTIECASDTTAPWAFRDAVYETLIQLCADICQRNGKTKLIWLGDKDKTLAYNQKADEMVLTVHRWFATDGRSCPGDWMYARMSDLAARVTAELSAAPAPAPAPADDPVPTDLDTFKRLWREMRKELQDNDASAYSQEAREWAVSKGLVTGGSSAEFNGMWEDLLTREQFVTVLYRWAKLEGKA